MLYDPNWKPAIPVWRQLLLGGVKILERDGWCQGAVISEYNQVCAAGSLVVQLDEGNIKDNGHYYMAISAMMLVTGCNVAEWNDKSGRTAAQVIAMIKKAAELPEDLVTAQAMERYNLSLKKLKELQYAL